VFGYFAHPMFHEYLSTYVQSLTICIKLTSIFVYFEYFYNYHVKFKYRIMKVSFASSYMDQL